MMSLIYSCFAKNVTLRKNIIIRIHPNIMKNGIPSQHYYELLEWKDENMKEFIERYNNRRMCELTTDELKELYLYIKENKGDD